MDTYELAEMVVRERYWQSVHFVARRGVPYAWADDVVSDALFRLIKGGHKELTKPLGYWLVTLRNTLSSYRKAQHSRPEVQKLRVTETDVIMENSGLIEAREELRKIAEVLDKARAEDRQALLRRLRGEKQGNAEKVRLARFRGQLRRLLREDDIDLI